MKLSELIKAYEDGKSIEMKNTEWHEFNPENSLLRTLTALLATGILRVPNKPPPPD